jgi:hypothetical protein
MAKLRSGLLFIWFVFIVSISVAQNVTIEPTGITPGASSIIEKKSYQKIIQMSNPHVGDMIIDTTFNKLRFYDGNEWVFFVSSADIESLALNAMRYGGNFQDEGGGIIVDSVGYTYLSGRFSQEIMFDDSTVYSNGGYDIYLAKLDPEGSLEWLRGIGSTSNEVSSQTLALDAFGSIYITGGYSSPISIGDTVLNSNRDSDIFVLKYSKDGVLEWARSFGGNGSDSPRTIKISNSGKIYVTGYFTGPCTFGDTLVGSVNSGLFILKIDSIGDFKKVLTKDFFWGADVDIDSNENTYAIGNFSGTKTVYDTTIVSNGDNDIFLIKYDTNFQFDWIRTFGGFQNDYSNSIRISPDNSIYIVGGFDSLAIFNTDTIMSNGGMDYYIIKYSENGDLIWLKTGGGEETDSGNSVEVDSDGNIYTIGIFENEIDLGDGAKFSSKGNFDTFIVKYNKAGERKWAKVFGGPTGDIAYGISKDKKHGIKVVGTFAQTALFGSKSITAKNSNDIFILTILE